MQNLKAHLFICTNCSCQDSSGNEIIDGAKTLRKNLKNRLVDEFGKEIVRVSAVNCLGHCEAGIASVIYPSQEWILNQNPDNEEQLYEKVKKICQK